MKFPNCGHLATTLCIFGLSVFMFPAAAPGSEGSAAEPAAAQRLQLTGDAAHVVLGSRALERLTLPTTDARPEEDALDMAWQALRLADESVSGDVLMDVRLSLLLGVSVAVDTTVMHLFQNISGTLTVHRDGSVRSWTIRQSNFANLSARAYLRDGKLGLMLPVSLDDDEDQSPVHTLAVTTCEFAGETLFCSAPRFASYELLRRLFPSGRSLNSLIQDARAVPSSSRPLPSSGFASPSGVASLYAGPNRPQSDDSPCCIGAWR